MKYRYKITHRAQEFILKLKALKIVFEKFPFLPHLEERWRRESLLKSSLFSARIEGNPLTVRQAESFSSFDKQKTLAKLEITNLLGAYKFVYFGKVPKKISLRFVRHLHQLVMRGISSNYGKLRQEPWAIFNQAGAAIYIAPAPFQLPKLMAQFVESTNSLKEEAVVKAGYLQYVFEKLHPFADGNGRVGRLLSAYFLQIGGFGFRGLVSFEEYIDEHWEAYYQALESSADASQFIEFFLEALARQAEAFLEKVKNQPQELPEDTLLPRRKEIFEIIRDHPYCSFDFIARRFLSVNQKTLHYDLQQLQKGGFVQKIGQTRGSRYRVS